MIYWLQFVNKILILILIFSYTIVIIITTNRISFLATLYNLDELLLKIDSE